MSSNHAKRKYFGWEKIIPFVSSPFKCQIALPSAFQCASLGFDINPDSALVVFTVLSINSVEININYPTNYLQSSISLDSLLSSLLLKHSCGFPGASCFCLLSSVFFVCRDKRFYFLFHCRLKNSLPLGNFTHLHATPRHFFKIPPRVILNHFSISFMK